MKYKCTNCGLAGVKLWREYNTMLSSQHFFCIACALIDQPRRNNSTVAFEEGRNCMIGMLVPAVPTELPYHKSNKLPRGASFWGLTSIPDWGLKWWFDLPPVIAYPHPEKSRALRTRVEEEEYKQKQLAAIEAETNRKVEETEFVVRATEEETHQYWRQWHTVLTYDEDTFGMYHRVTSLVCNTNVAVFWYHIEGRRVAFIQAESSTVDEDAIEKWARRFFPMLKQHPERYTHKFDECIRLVGGDWYKNPTKKAQFDFVHQASFPNSHTRFVPIEKYQALEKERDALKLRVVFETKISAWRKDTLTQSSTTEIMKHPAFDELLSMPQSIIDFIIDHLRRGDHSVHWLILLEAKSVTLPHPPPSMRGKIYEQSFWWIAWYDCQQHAQWEEKKETT